MNGVDKHVTLQKGGNLRIDGARGMKVRVEDGSAWLTQDTDAADYVMQAGEAVELNGKGTTLVTTFDSCRLSLVAPRISAFSRLMRLWINPAAA